MTDISIPSANLAGSLVRFNSEQYHLMIQQGIINEDSSTELLRGLTVTKNRADLGDTTAHGPRHRMAVRMLTKLAARIDSDQRHLQIQLPVHTSDFDELEPDAAVVQGPHSRYAERLPAAADVSCVVEVALNSLERDQGDKLAIYAGAGISQYIIVNLRDEQVEVYSDPIQDSYPAHLVFKKGQSIHLLLGRGESMVVQVTDLLP